MTSSRATYTTRIGECFIASAFATIALALLAAPAAAQPPCPVGTILTATATLVDAAPAVPNSFIIHPDGSGQTLASRGLTIEVCVECSGTPLVGAPAAAVTLTGTGVYICVSGANADGPTGATGCTTFTGTIVGGGCSSTLDVNVGGTVVGTVAVAVRSPDVAGTSPGFVDAGDLSYFAAALPSALGSPTFSPCVDFNVDSRIDASDLSYFASALGLFGTTCP